MKMLPQRKFGARIQPRSLKTRVTLFMLAIIVIGIWTMTFYAGRILREDMQRQLGDQQFSTTSLIAEEINQNLDVRLRALEKVAEQIDPAMMGNKTALHALLEGRTVFMMMFNGGAFVTRPDGTAIADVSDSTARLGLNYMERDHIAAALREGKTSIGRPVVGRTLQAPVIGMAAPLYGARGRVIGALVGVTDLGKPNFLDRIVENRYGKTGGYLIVAPKHRLIVTATDKRRIMEASPAPGRFPLIDRFMQGYEGTGVLIDPLGVEVLQSAKGIPAAGWYAAAQLPADEAFAPIRTLQQRMLLAAILLTLLACGLIWLMLNYQLSPMLVAVKTLAILSDTEQPPQPLPVTRRDEIGELIGGFNRLLESLRKREGELRESEERYRALVGEAAVGVAEIAMETGRFITVNRRFCAMVGRTEEELLAASYMAITHPEDLHHHEENTRRMLAGEIGHYSLEKRYLRKDGEIVWVNITVSPLWKPGEIQDRSMMVVENITARKHSEAKLQDTLESLRKAVGTTIQVLASVVEARDPYTAGHQIRSADLARTIAVELGLSQERVDGIRIAGSIHDIGKISVPAEILAKPTKLSEIEFSLIKAHSQKGYEMLKDVKSPWPLAEIVYQHHERMDGSGYPRSLKGEEILIEARILMVADVVEAMASHRPYRPGLGITAALNEIEKNRGVHYDNAVVDACLSLFREKGFQLQGV